MGDYGYLVTVEYGMEVNQDFRHLNGVEEIGDRLALYCGQIQFWIVPPSSSGMDETRERRWVRTQARRKAVLQVKRSEGFDYVVILNTAEQRKLKRGKIGPSRIRMSSFEP